MVIRVNFALVTFTLYPVNEVVFVVIVKAIWCSRSSKFLSPKLYQDNERKKYFSSMNDVVTYFSYVSFFLDSVFASIWNRMRCNT